MKTTAVLIISTIISVNAFTQHYTQTIKGTIIDRDSHAPVEFASVQFIHDASTGGTTTDTTGIFRFENVPVGRVSLQARCVGYESTTLSNLEVTTGKELVVNIEMTESTVELGEVTIKAYNNKEEPKNRMSSVSARTFSVEESMRYAGSGNDISRMAMNFAGVKASYDAVNEIVIRGNSPIGLIFTLEGVNIPNPSHFGDGGVTGGPVSMLNNNVLANSDFLTGAFPAEYTNTISGVFDLKMRNGNYEKYEFLGQVSTTGVELGAEGPIPVSKGASYLLNYRYSTLQLMDLAGMDMGVGTAIPKYQDLCFKLNFPSRKAGNISIFGLGGRSKIKMYDSERDTTLEKREMAFEYDYEMDMTNDNYSGVVGISHSYIFGNSAYSRLTLSASTIFNRHFQDSLSTIDRNPIQLYHSDFTRSKYMGKFFIHKKFNSKNTLRLGVSVEKQTFALTDSIFSGGLQNYRILRDYSGNDLLLQSYAQYQHRFNDRIRINLGLSYLHQLLTGHYSIEPRTGLKWEVSNGNTVSAAYGLHSLVCPAEIAQQKVLQPDGSYSKPNTGLGFTKSHHLVLGYDKVFSHKIRIKSEVYYQYIYNAAVEAKPSSYSLLNRGSYSSLFVNELQNGGTGCNYGIELTLEKFMHRGTYFLSTLSLYDSKYRGSDGVLRNSAFNSNYVLNLLGGKEFNIGNGNSRSVKKITVDGKFNWAGGQYYSPVDLAASQQAGTTVYDDANAYSLQLPDYYRFDLRVGYKAIGRRSTKEIAIGLNNLTNHKNAFYVKYDPGTGTLKTVRQFGFMPDLLFRITF